MEITKILKTILKNDKVNAYTSSETRLLFALMGLYEERANEKGQFVATLEEVCKRYGTTCKTHLLKIRETLSKKGIPYRSSSQKRSNILPIRDGLILHKSHTKGNTKILSLLAERGRENKAATTPNKAKFFFV